MEVFCSAKPLETLQSWCDLFGLSLSPIPLQYIEYGGWLTILLVVLWGFVPLAEVEAVPEAAGNLGSGIPATGNKC